MLNRTICKATGLDKPIVEMTDEELVKQFKRKLTKLRYIQIAMDTVIGAVTIGAVYTAYNMIF
jgi:hypothetical protein